MRSGSRLPRGWQQGAKVAIERGRQARQHIGELGMRLVAVGLGGGQQAHDRGGALAGPLGPGEQPVPTSQGNGPDRVLNAVVVRALSRCHGFVGGKPIRQTLAPAGSTSGGPRSWTALSLRGRPVPRVERTACLPQPRPAPWRALRRPTCDATRTTPTSPLATRSRPSDPAPASACLPASRATTCGHLFRMAGMDCNDNRKVQYCSLYF